LPEPFAVAVVVRSHGEAGLQGLRCGLSLSLGDRVPRVYLLDSGRQLLAAAPGSETAAVLHSLVDDVGIEVVIESGLDAPTGAGLGRRSRGRILAEAAGAQFQQVF
jgi:hypothetical protein